MCGPRCLYHPDYNRRPRPFTGSADLRAEAGSARGLPGLLLDTTGGELHPALRLDPQPSSGVCTVKHDSFRSLNDSPLFKERKRSSRARPQPQLSIQHYSSPRLPPSSEDALFAIPDVFVSNVLLKLVSHLPSTAMIFSSAGGSTKKHLLHFSKVGLQLMSANGRRRE